MTSFGAVAEALALSILFDIRLTFDFIILVICISGIIYFYDFFRELKIPEATTDGETKRKGKYSRYYALPLLLFILYIIIISLYGSTPSIIFSIFLILVGVLYDPIFKRITKIIPAFKDFYVAFCWLLLPVFMIIYYQKDLSLLVVVTLIFVFSRDIVNAFYCDIKDISNDKNAQLKTYAVINGASNTIYVLQWVSIFSVLLLTISTVIGILPLLSVSLVIPVILTSLLMNYSQKIQKYSPFFVEIEYYFWYLSIILFGLILKGQIGF